MRRALTIAAFVLLAGGAVVAIFDLVVFLELQDPSEDASGWLGGSTWIVTATVAEVEPGPVRRSIDLRLTDIEVHDEHPFEIFGEPFVVPIDLRRRDSVWVALGPRTRVELVAWRSEPFDLGSPGLVMEPGTWSPPEVGVLDFRDGEPVFSTIAADEAPGWRL